MAKIESIRDVSDKALVEIKTWLEPWFGGSKGNKGGGAVPIGPIDSTENVGLPWGVQSNDPAVGPEVLGYVLTADGVGGSKWGLFSANDTPSFEHLVITNPCLYSYWPLDDVGPGAADASGNSRPLVENPNTGTYDQPFGQQLGNAPSYQQSGPWPDVPAATAFQGLNTGTGGFIPGSMLYRDLVSETVMQTSWSVVGWAYPTDRADLVTDGGAAWSWFVSSTQFALLILDSTEVVFRHTRNGVPGDVTITTPIALDSWYFLAATYDSVGDLMTLYLDGVSQGTDSLGGTGSSGGYHRIGAGGVASGAMGGYFNGKLAQWAMFNCALTADEINDLAAATSPGFTDGAAGTVLTADGSGGASWEYPTIEVEYT